MNGKGVARRVRRDELVDAGGAARLVAACSYCVMEALHLRPQAVTPAGDVQPAGVGMGRSTLRAA
jgi:hypothetical protein